MILHLKNTILSSPFILSLSKRSADKLGRAEQRPTTMAGTGAHGFEQRLREWVWPAQRKEGRIGITSQLLLSTRVLVSEDDQKKT